MKSKKKAQVVAISALLLIPALYVLIFLGAYWDRQAV